MRFDSSILKPGDCLLYHPNSLIGWIIAIKTWNKVSHVEIYIGNNKSVASRDGIGVDVYPLRTNNLAHVLRPNEFFDFHKAMKWFYKKACGQKYDFLGLLCFTLAVRRGSKDRMFCSEFATRWYRNAKLRLFAKNYDADHVAPAQFLMTPTFNEIWKKK